jgi:AmmeMemoRadiSam system protein B
MKTRKASFAGSWYPKNASACEKEIQAFLKEGAGKPFLQQAWVGGIVPHAGWYFSGNIACNVISCLAAGPAPDVLVIFGMHLPSGSTNYIMTEGAWETPFGDLEIEARLAVGLAEEFPFHVENAYAFTPDNTIELQLPFIKYFFDKAKIVPMGVPPVKQSLEIGTRAVDMANQLGLTVKVIGSTDLTHYGSNYGFLSKGTGAKALEWVKTENDRRIIDAMLAMDPDRVMDEARANRNACCAGAAATAIAAAKHLGADRAKKLTYATSHDKSPGDSFVGYVGILF